MQYRQLGRSDLMVSEISLGSWLTYGPGVEAERATACVRRAFEVGINFFDTANVYGRGAAESFLGEVLSGVDRSSYVLATKAYFPMSDTDRGLSAAQIRKQSEASLQRLRTDYVDLYQCHRYDKDTPLEETMEALTELVRSGKARYIGFSEWTADQIEAALAIPGVERFVSSQPEYSMLWRKAEQVIPLCAREGIGQVVWSPLAQGALTGKYRPGSPPPADSRAAEQVDGLDDGPLPGGLRAGRRAAAAAHRRRPRPDHGPAGPGVGAAGGERGLGHHRRQPARPDRRQRGRLGGRPRRRGAGHDRRGARRCGRALS